ncbi:hypothetical protein TB1_012184 [Malus domestica]
MSPKMSVLGMFVFLLLASATKAHESSVFDVTSAEYGAKPGSDITFALAKAWNDSCASPSASKVVVPSGTYKLSGASFRGPCKAPIELQGTWVGFKHVDMITVSGGGTFDGQGAFAWSQNNCSKSKHCSGFANLRFDFVTNSIIQDVTSLISKNFHVHVYGCNNVTFQHVHITALGDSKNTNGIHIGKSTGINITHTYIGTGDDCVSIGDGNNQIAVTNVSCGPSHGISIGSLGRYDNEESLAGIIKCDNLPPSKVKISDVSFKNIQGSSATALSLKIVCSSGSPCENVELADIDLTYSGAKGTLTSQCSNVKPTISGLTGALACATSSVMFPPLI